jgi:hypothetical protein
MTKTNGKDMQHLPPGSAPAGPRSTSDPNRIISMKLKALYRTVEEQGIPDRFVELLERLDDAEKRAKSKAGGGDG